jgi:hypothetical protein
MSIADYGANVYLNGEQIKTWDKTPYDVVLRETHRHHAILGKGRIRWCAHKSVPVLYIDGTAMEDQELRKLYARPIRTDEDGYIWEEAGAIYLGAIDGYCFLARPFGGNMIDMELREPDGSYWKARAGYQFGDSFPPDSEGNSHYSAVPWIYDE